MPTSGFPACRRGFSAPKVKLKARSSGMLCNVMDKTCIIIRLRRSSGFFSDKQQFTGPDDEPAAEKPEKHGYKRNSKRPEHPGCPADGPISHDAKPARHNQAQGRLSHEGAGCLKLYPAVHARSPFASPGKLDQEPAGGADRLNGRTVY
ncbi:hypothetical protein M9Y10_029543 [Tritrichomonas musculus]|uniref:Uncharacterized protein n=1 Tax=Tritrichomonas musculus TaxID=1915356 RepID=A0ABR2KN29_9EUKA